MNHAEIHHKTKKAIGYLLTAGGLSARELSRLLGVSYVTLCEIRRRPDGEYRVSAEFFERLRYIYSSFVKAIQEGTYDPTLLPSPRRHGAADERWRAIESVINPQ